MFNFCKKEHIWEIHWTCRGNSNVYVTTAKTAKQALKHFKRHANQSDYIWTPTNIIDRGEV